MTVLVLHSRLSGYWMACMRTFKQKYNGTFYVVRKKVSSEAPFDFQDEKGIKLFDFASFSGEELLNFSKEKKPDLVYIDGWSERAYLSVSRYFCKKGIPVICGIDNHWSGNVRQLAGKFYLRYLATKAFNYIWIPGLYQFEFARQLGFDHENILTGMYSADVDAFSKVRKDSTDKMYPKSFLFVGRFIERKGVMQLAQAFQKLKRSSDSSWSLTLIGNGPLKNRLKEFDDIEVLDFVQPDDLPEVMSRYGVFMLPSLSEPWGVVVHEAAAAGLPIISTYNCGAARALIRDGYNGYLTEGGSTANLFRSMNKITKLSDQELYNMGEHSHELSKQITPQTWSSTLNEIIIDSK